MTTSESLWHDEDDTLSDESDFIGTAQTRAVLQQRIGKGLKRHTETALSEVVLDVVAKRRRLETRKHERAVSGILSAFSATGITTNHNVTDCLRFRPQVKATQAKLLEGPTAVKVIAAINTVVEDHSRDNELDCDPSCWQHRTETINAFLNRGPVAEPSTAVLGPWLWVSNPSPNRQISSQVNVTAFVEQGARILSRINNPKIDSQAEEVEVYRKPTKRQLTLRAQLEDELIELAVKTDTLCGKWMLFPSQDDLQQTWQLVSEATSQGKLGPRSKVATYDQSDPSGSRVICVYTYDFTDKDDVFRVLSELASLNVSPGLSAGRSSIYYKCDAYTYLDINSGNPYGIRASLFASNGGGSGGPVERLLRKRKLASQEAVGGHPDRTRSLWLY
ncbi:hypothetical protein BAUCODRAFT_509737 [Baudoinia panamericana UAMH 10762]|uniref:DUF1917 domain-containing protein n=1 Tax=Baudoinia panamericana (strain UAMH 10762) TaxID=717646 RepID=M2NAS1_BAUPA|nr:uncharacterized protein BAUCODRAFT_509737 [Baudoinia panamericana UAMH 10762]EMC95940.1 hypothetical protein BAUCODRAFT_509737 [Baudoinia panamericana UAMH 10762]